MFSLRIELTLGEVLKLHKKAKLAYRTFHGALDDTGTEFLECVFSYILGHTLDELSA